MDEIDNSNDINDINHYWTIDNVDNDTLKTHIQFDCIQLHSSMNVISSIKKVTSMLK
jgi:hypothetical protein